MKVALRVIGLIAVLIGVADILVHILGIIQGAQIESLAAGGEHPWAGAMSPDDVEARTRLLGGVGILVGALCAVAGCGYVLLKNWVLWVSLTAVLVALLFAPMSRLLMPPTLQFAGPNVADYAQASLVALVASAAPVFRKAFATNRVAARQPSARGH
jgi:hypothetical protein